MKKVIAMLLAVTLMASCVMTMAVAAETTTLFKGATYTISPDVKFKDIPDPTAASSAEQHTDMWVRVAAAGQIRCTIPLVLIYDTNIDGGSTTINSGYQITNTSTAALDVTKIEVKHQTGTLTIQPFLNYDPATADLDTYAVQLTIDDKVYDLNTTSFDGSGTNRCFTIPKPASKGGSNSMNIQVDAKFAPLTFVTSAAAADGKATDKTKGVKMLEVKYTVGISTATDATKGGSIYGTTVAVNEGGTANENKAYTVSATDGTISINVPAAGGS